MDVNIKAALHRETFDGWKIHTRCIPEYELVYVVRGYGEIQIVNRQISVGGGDLICFKPGVSHSLWLKKKPYMEFYGVHFDFSDDMLMKNVPDYVHLESGHWIEVQMRNLYNEYRQKGFLYKWKQEIIMQQILCELLRKRHVEQEPISNKRIGKVLAYIHENPFRDYTLPDLLEYTGIKKSLFLKDFHNVTGTTPMQYIMDLRLEQARDLLSETDLQVSLISERCGFSDPFYFSRCFKKRYTLSPRQYREYKKFENDIDASKV